jgi:uncharacterized protein YraI
MEYYENAGGAVAQLSSGGGDQPPPPPPPPDAVGVVTASRLNVRTGPSLNHPVIALLQRGQQVRLLGRNSAASWLKVELAPNYHGWVFASYIRSSVPITNLPVVQ